MPFPPRDEFAATLLKGLNGLQAGLFLGHMFGVFMQGVSGCIPIREVVELRDSDLRVCAHFPFFSLKFYGATVMSLVETGCCWM